MVPGSAARSEASPSTVTDAPEHQRGIRSSTSNAEGRSMSTSTLTVPSDGYAVDTRSSTGVPSGAAVRIVAGAYRFSTMPLDEE